MGEAKAAQDAALLDPAHRGDVGDHGCTVPHEENRGKTVRKGKGGPGVGNALVTVDRGEHGLAVQHIVCIDTVHVDGDVLLGVGLDRPLDALHSPLRAAGGAECELDGGEDLGVGCLVQIENV